MVKVHKVRVKLGARSYDIIIGSQLTSELKRLSRLLRSKKAFVVSDVSLKKARRRLVAQLKSCGYDVREIRIKAGEGLKDFKIAFSLYGRLLDLGAHRDAAVFALGGGSVGDAAGFVASTYLRGVNWVGVPTTLLAQVDSAIGGKTAVNHPQGKNLIGTFHQPKAVLCDVSYLETLSEREITSGLGEAIKYGLTYDRHFFNYICKNWQLALSLDQAVLVNIVRRSAQFKAQAVSRDEFDQKGVREVLNFGHTMAHALEKATSYKVYQHGEAVIWGMRFALALSQVRGHISVKNRGDIENFLSQIKIPPWPKKVKFSALIKLTSKDKKVRHGRLHYVLLKNLGHTCSDSSVSPQDLIEAHKLLLSEKAL